MYRFVDKYIGITQTHYTDSRPTSPVLSQKYFPSGLMHHLQSTQHIYYFGKVSTKHTKYICNINKGSE